MEKADWMAGWTMSNAIRLHWDSVLLFNHKSYSSSLALSILSMEEIAKAHLLEDIIFNAAVYEWDARTSWRYIKNMFFSHRKKQTFFADRLFPFYRRLKKGGGIKASPFVRMAQSGRLEKYKQESLYVGLSRPTFINSRIRSPHKIPRSKPLRMITLVNDYLLDLSVGNIGGYYHIDSEYITKMLNRRFIRQLKKEWNLRGRIGTNALQKFNSFAAG